MIKKRIKRIASYLEGLNNFLDVGADHAYLSIYAYQNLNIHNSTASDISVKALEQAKTNIKKYHLEKNIITILADGISFVDECFDALVISGMGGHLIKDILKKDEEKLKYFKYLILSPNNDIYVVRKFLASLGYEIIKEDFVFDYKYYPISVFKYSGKINSYTELELKYGPILLQERPEDFINYLNNQYDYFLNLGIEDPKIKENMQEISTIIKK